MSQANVAPHLEPLYEQVYKILRLRIISGEWKPQSLLPGEIMLSQEMGVSVGTVRKAMDQLSRENLVVRERGRGTFVRSDGEWHSAGSDLRLVDGEGRPVTPSILLDSARISEATELETRMLKIRSLLSAKARVLRLERRWMLGEALLGTEVSSVDANRFTDVADLLSGSEDVFVAAYDDAIRARSDMMIWQLGVAPPHGAGASICGNAHLCRMTLDERGLPVELRQFNLCLQSCRLQLSHMLGVLRQGLTRRQHPLG